MKIQRLLTLLGTETNMKLEQLEKEFDGDRIYDRIYNHYNKLTGFKTEDISTIYHIVNKSKFANEINVSNVDILEIIL